MKENNMSRKINRKSKDDMRPEYDFAGGVRGKFYKEYMRGTNVVLLDPDVAAVFPDAETVNNALRSLAQLAKRQVKSRARKAKTA
jgi:hypothetical protein